MKGLIVLTLQLIIGRPPITDYRLEKEIKTYDLLDSLDISYTRVDHQPAMTIADCNEINDLLGVHLCKNLFLCNKQKTQFYLLIMPGSKKFQTKYVSKQLGIARLSFAPEHFLKDFMNITPGSVSILGLMNDNTNQIQLLIDKELLDEEYFACHPCINTSSLKIRTSDIFIKYLDEVHHKPVFLDLGKEYL